MARKRRRKRIRTIVDFMLIDDINERQSAFCKYLISEVKLSKFKNRSFFRNFTNLYPENILSFKYVNDLKKFVEEEL